MEKWREEEEGLGEEGARDREGGSSSSHHHKVGVVVMNLEIKGTEKREEEEGERGDTGERREREDGAMGDE